MGKRIISQRRGRGTSTYKSPSFRFAGEAKHNTSRSLLLEGEVVDIINCAGHSAPLVIIDYLQEQTLSLAPEGIAVGDLVHSGPGAEVKSGNTLCLKDIPEGVEVYNVEAIPGDGGKFVRSAGSSAKIVSRLKDKVVLMLPSKKQKEFHAECRATIGVVAGSGRVDKPLLKAGNAFYKAKAKNKLYPRVSGSAMNAVDHPLGNKRTSRKSKAKPVSRNAPPGRKVGLVGARRTGRKR